MRRIRYEHSGGPEVLFEEDVPVPTPGPGELLVRVEAVGVTLPVVRKVRESREPVPLGGEVAGEVAALGEGVDAYAVGDRVTGLCFGHGYAEYAVLNRAMASAVPAGATAQDAVALVRSGVVALGALESARPGKGESVLVTAAASGVGHLALQLARLRGAARVVAAVGDPAKADFVRSLGADAVVTYTDESWGEPCDIVLDAVGGDLLPRAVRAVAPGGRLVAYSSGGGTIEAYDLLVGGKSVIGFQVAHIARNHPARYAGWIAELWALRGEGSLRPAVHAAFPLADAALAHAAVENRLNRGKVVLTVP
ncbi:zinc-binding dehydrogenase [Streptomyces sp. NBC_01789]|uniref:quinone oxidoreductase family protein n=1 Tax=Streptomyces sp. NBC_01789 TaxID=2975941 RepID=UPI002253927D|nr:zinc-binding dehydrogenase [Streptomyces sp. NBC_01789]MCX4447500.1 zinc-binding dehydrogenase [Streptomyces sp. NBC_01789]